MERKIKIFGALIIFFAFLGFLISLFSTIDHLNFIKGEGDGICDAIKKGACSVAHGSRFSEISGIPITIFGMSAYFIFMLFGVIILLKKSYKFIEGMEIIVIYSLLAVFYSIFLAGVLFLEKSACPFCIMLYFINLSLFIFSLLLYRKKIFYSLRKPLFPISIFLFVGISFLLIIIYHPMKIEAKKHYEMELQKMVSKTNRIINLSLPAGRPHKGFHNSKIQIVEISDLECPYCEKMFNVIEDYSKKNLDTVSLTFIHFPLDTSCNKYISYCLHKTACETAKASICAYKEGVFWEYLTLSFEYRQDHGEENLLQFAEALGIPREQFKECLNSPDTEKILKEDIDFAINLGVSVTPTTFINGKKIEGYFNIEKFKKIVEGIKKEGKE